MPTHIAELQYFFSQHKSLRVMEESAMSDARKLADKNGFLPANKLRIVLGNYARILEKEACEDPMYHKLTMLAIRAHKPDFRQFDMHPTDNEWEKALDINGDTWLLWELLQHIGACESCFNKAPGLAREIKEAIDNADKISGEEISRITVPDHVIKAAQDLIRK